MVDLSGAESTADISPCGLYRYSLTRRWADGATALFVMLNPSTADASKDDPTIRRCISFAKREGCGALEVVNLYSFRATDPKDLTRTVHSPNGVASNGAILSAAARASIVIAAWGGWIPKAWDVRPREVIHMIDRPAYALGVTSNGQPRHPLYVRADAPLRLYEAP